MITDGCAAVFTIVPSSLLGLEAETLLWVTVEPAKLPEVAEALTRHRSVRYLGATLDGNSLLCEVIADSTRGLFALLTLKRGFVETPWWRDQHAEHSAADGKLR